MKLPGAAVTIVPGVADGGGVSELVRKRGWMCSSLAVGLTGLLADAERLRTMKGRESDERRPRERDGREKLEAVKLKKWLEIGDEGWDREFVK